MAAIDFKQLKRRYKLYTLEELKDLYISRKEDTISKIIAFSRKIENINHYNFANDFYSEIGNIKSKDMKILKSKYISALILIEATNYFIDYYTSKLVE